jgi:preprotein translocase subunit SecG
MNIVVYYILLTLHVLACLLLICVVLLQQGKNQDLASAFGGGSQTAFGPRGSANVLSRLTTILGAVFMITSMTLSMVRPRSSSVLDQMATPASKSGAAPSPAPAPANPSH